MELGPPSSHWERGPKQVQAVASSGAAGGSLTERTERPQSHRFLQKTLVKLNRDSERLERNVQAARLEQRSNSPMTGRAAMTSPESGSDLSHLELETNLSQAFGMSRPATCSPILSQGGNALFGPSVAGSPDTLQPLSESLLPPRAATAEPRCIESPGLMGKAWLVPGSELERWRQMFREEARECLQKLSASFDEYTCSQTATTLDGWRKVDRETNMHLHSYAAELAEGCKVLRSVAEEFRPDSNADGRLSGTLGSMRTAVDALVQTRIEYSMHAQELAEKTCQNVLKVWDQEGLQASNRLFTFISQHNEFRVDQQQKWYDNSLQLSAIQERLDQIEQRVQNRYEKQSEFEDAQRETLVRVAEMIDASQRHAAAVETLLKDMNSSLLNGQNYHSGALMDHVSNLLMGSGGANGGNTAGNAVATSVKLKARSSHALMEDASLSHLREKHSNQHRSPSKSRPSSSRNSFRQAAFKEEESQNGGEQQREHREQTTNNGEPHRDKSKYLTQPIEASSNAKTSRINDMLVEFPRQHSAHYSEEVDDETLSLFDRLSLMGKGLMRVERAQYEDIAHWQEIAGKLWDSNDLQTSEAKRWRQQAETDGDKLRKLAATHEDTTKDGAQLRQNLQALERSIASTALSKIKDIEVRGNLRMNRETGEVEIVAKRFGYIEKKPTEAAAAEFKDLDIAGHVIRDLADLSSIFSVTFIIESHCKPKSAGQIEWWAEHCKSRAELVKARLEDSGVPERFPTTASFVGKQGLNNDAILIRFCKSIFPDERSDHGKTSGGVGKSPRALKK